MLGIYTRITSCFIRVARIWDYQRRDSCSLCHRLQLDETKAAVTTDVTRKTRCGQHDDDDDGDDDDGDDDDDDDDDAADNVGLLPNLQKQCVQISFP